MDLVENIRIALVSIRSNWLRSILTLSIISLGLMSLVGILTAIDGLLNSINNNFNELGSNSFSIVKLQEEIKTNTGRRRFKTGKVVSYQEAMQFKKRFDYPNTTIAINQAAARNIELAYNKTTSEQEYNITGIDNNFLGSSAYKIQFGRNFTYKEIENGSPTAIIGYKAALVLFGNNVEKALGKIIQVDDHMFQVIAVLEEKGTAFGSSRDAEVFIPISKSRVLYASSKTNFDLMVNVKDSENIEMAISEATGLMRAVRQLKPKDLNNFTIEKSGSLMETLKDLTSKLRIATILIGLMTLLGAAIGLMNIMLVSVTERTKEIGVAKALGATRRNILIQFVTESTTITLIGGVFGIILGIIMGNIVTMLMKGTFIFPVGWVILGLVLCISTGIISGIYPAIKASKLDPIESLRYE